MQKLIANKVIHDDLRSFADTNVKDTIRTNNFKVSSYNDRINEIKNRNLSKTLKHENEKTSNDQDS
jgi:hypothetical protein